MRFLLTAKEGPFSRNPGLLALTRLRASVTSTDAPKPSLIRMPKNVRFLPPISGRLIRSRGPRPDSAKTYGNPVRRTACRKTDEFPVPVTATLIGGLTLISANA
jgi:hypothetical protein